MSYKYKSAGSILAALLAVVSPKLLAQTTPVTTPPAEDKDESIVLSPFVVSASEDAGGYGANSTLAGTRVRTDLRDVASAISVVTQQFLQDTGSKNISDLLVYTPSTEVGGLNGNFSGAAGGHTFTENLASTSTRVRGLDAADNTRDYFLTDIPADTFNVGRFDLQRGPNSILFGIGSPAGIINASTNSAAFKTSYTFENRFDQYGSLRDSGDFNQVLIPDVLAIRVAGLIDDEKFEQRPAYNNTTRYYGAIRLDPKLFGDSSHTSIRANYEKGRVRSDNPRDLPPSDNISTWFTTGNNGPAGNLGFNKLTVNEFSIANPNPSGTPLPGATGSSLTSATYELGGNAETRSYWPDVINYYEGTPVASNSISGASGPGASPIKTIAAEAHTGLGLGNNHGIAGVVGFRPLGIPDLSQIAGYVGTAGTSGAYTYPQSVVPGGVYYADKVMTDPTIFNFYKELLDGPNKHEWQNWEAINVALDQTFLDDRIGLEVAFDHQYYNQGQEQWLSGENYNINIDVNQTFADGTPNPNVGRPYVGNAASNQNFESTTLRNTVRVTLTGELRAEDFLGKTKLADILGRHVFTALYERNTVTQSSDQYAEFATTPQFIADNFYVSPGSTLKVGQIGQDREFDWIDYIGPSLASASSAHGANLANINYVIAPPINQTVENFNATWNVTNNPSSPTYVNPASTGVAIGSPTPIAGDIAVGPSQPLVDANGNPLKDANGNAYVDSTGKPLNGFFYYDPKGYYAAGHDPATIQAAFLAGGANPGNPNVNKNSFVYSYQSTKDGTFNTASQAENPANYVGWSNEQITWLRASDPTQKPSLVTTANRTRFRDLSEGITWQGHFLGGDLVPTFGYRKDRITSYETNSAPDANTGISSLEFQDDLSSRTDVAGTSRSWGGVYHLPKSLSDRLPWGSGLSVFYDHSDNFKADALRRSMNGLPLPNPKGLTKEYGVTFTTLHDKLSLKIAHFNTRVANATLNGTNGNDIAGLGNNGYFLADGVIWGYGWATALQDYITGRTPNSQYGDYATSDGFDRNTPADAAAADAYNKNGGTSPTGISFIGGTAITNAWVHIPLPAQYFPSFNLSPAIDATRGAASGNLRDSYINGPDDANNANVGGGSSFGNHQITVDNLSKGNEIELTAQPVKNWNLTLNYSHVKATHQNIDTAAQQFIGSMTAFMNGPGGQIRMWGNGARGNTLGADWDQSIVAPFTVELNDLGHEAPEISPWRLNLVTTYNFDRGVAKGFFIGGAFRIDSARIIGYRFDPNFLNVNSTDPNYAAVASVTHGGLNVNDPIRGKNEDHVDGWIGYSRKISHKLNWRIQLNARNIAEKDHLIESQANPDGSLALARISEGMSWQLTNTFEF